MKNNAERQTTPETGRQPYKLSPDKIAYMGRLAINPEILGINDPLTHLYRYLECDNNNKNRVLSDIKIDLETDIAERLPSTPFVNKVGFEFTGNDFVSVQDEISMKSMTSTNLRIFSEMSINNPLLMDEFVRAKMEAIEVDKLSAWFNNAPIGGYLIFESLPIGDQTIAISRIYQKTSDNLLEGSFVSLYNPTIDQFNQLRESLNIDTNTNSTELEILDNNYEFYDPNLTNSDNFIDYYVKNYDKLLQNESDQQYYFGLVGDKNIKKQNGILKVRQQPRLTDTYLEVIKTLASSKGIVTPELLLLTNKTNIKKLQKGDIITTHIARDILGNTIKKIASVIDMASDKLLDDINRSDASSDESFAAMSHFGEQAISAGVDYSSNNCPEFNNDQQQINNEGSEYNILNKIFGNDNLPDNFGEAKIGICRISNCPSHGESKRRPKKTLVGGCDVCVGCHHLFSKGKSPEKEHKATKLKIQKAIEKNL